MHFVTTILRTRRSRPYTDAGNINSQKDDDRITDEEWWTSTCLCREIQVPAALVSRLLLSNSSTTECEHPCRRVSDFAETKLHRKFLPEPVVRFFPLVTTCLFPFSCCHSTTCIVARNIYISYGVSVSFSVFASRQDNGPSLDRLIFHVLAMLVRKDDLHCGLTAHEIM